MSIHEEHPLYNIIKRPNNFTSRTTPRRHYPKLVEAKSPLGDYAGRLEASGPREAEISIKSGSSVGHVASAPSAGIARHEVPVPVATDPISMLLAQHEIIQHRAARIARGLPAVERPLQGQDARRTVAQMASHVNVHPLEIMDLPQVPDSAPEQARSEEAYTPVSEGKRSTGAIPRYPRSALKRHIRNCLTDHPDSTAQQVCAHLDEIDLPEGTIPVGWLQKGNRQLFSAYKRDQSIRAKIDVMISKVKRDMGLR